jgi:hypothetical protein
MGTGEGAALLAGVQRGTGRLYYAATDRSFWVPLRLVRPIPPDVLPNDCLERFLSGILLFLDAEECIVERQDEGAIGLAVEAPRLTQETIDELRRRLGERLKALEVVPASMRLLSVRLDLVSLPAAAGG